MASSRSRVRQVTGGVIRWQAARNRSSRPGSIPLAANEDQRAVEDLMIHSKAALVLQIQHMWRR